MKNLILKFVVGISAFLLLTQCLQDRAKPKPQADFSYTIGTNGDVVFTNNSLNATEFTWNFGDGNTSQESDPEYQYTTNESFTVTLQASGPGGTDVATAIVNINNVPTTITLNNKAFTPISVSVAGVTGTIPVGQSISFSGPPGSSVSVSGSTSGQTTSGTLVGLLLTWSFSTSFPDNGDNPSDMNVGVDYFFLKIVNLSSYSITKVYVNYNLVPQTLDNIIIPPDGNTYNIGYYGAYSNSNVRLEGSSGFWYNDISLPFTQNQSYTFTATN